MQNPNFTLKVHNEVLHIVRDRSGTRATGVVHVDANGEEYEQPADIVLSVCLSAPEYAPDDAVRHRRNL
jgi:hypothetical protein